MRTSIFMLSLGLAACGATEQPQPAEDQPEAAEAAPMMPDSPSQIEAAADASPSDTPARMSSFAKLDAANCRVVRENREEAGYVLRRCGGPGGYALEVSESDLRQGIEVVAPSGAKTDIKLNELVAKGAFSTLGSTAEWRGADSARPETLTFRLGVADGSAPSRPDSSKLVVARLQPTPCIVAVIEPGPTQSEQARKAADGSLAACLS
ncbi:hypothetical protein [Sphingomonas sp. LY160]|uniref:hypothetical protein n=1 Tax=Sphingomonas sp. LY160 TaxID=3095342 RepID=UPI002ADEF544|nr:hypothetical protein [Sphingomonas sp. LY160]MEA1072736.1 hypothetical protein [Sphingomonas sp. LY160]